MDSDSWTRLRPLVEEALARPALEREAYLREASAGDEVLLARALELVALENETGGILGDERDATPLGTAARANGGRPRPGDRLGPWRLARELGRGGMGAVWLATRADEAFEKQVALKLIRGGLDGDAVLERFHREQRLLAGLEHPGIARLIDVGRDEHEHPYLVMEYVEGLPLDAWCRERAPDLRARIELFLEVCAAVEHAHGRLVVHRDLKPGNVLVDSQDRPKLLDFGIAKLLAAEERGQVELTATGQHVYTPHYASPEQVRGEPIGTATDVYSLGVLLYELLTGERPFRFESSSPTEILRVIGETRPRPPSAAARERTTGAAAQSPSWSRRLTGDLDAIVLTALRKEPERRYASVEAFAADLRRHLDGLPVRARPDTLGYRTRKFLRRHGVPVGAVVALVLALVAGLVGTTTQFLRAEAGWTAEARQNRLASQRLGELERLSENLAQERTQALERADDLERLTGELSSEKAVAERRFGEVRRFATSVIFDIQSQIAPLAGATLAREQLVRLGLEHLDRLAAEAGGDDELALELAGAYVQMGDVLGEGVGFNLGRTAEAIEAYERAIALARGVGSAGTPRSRGWPILGVAGRKLVDALRVVGREDREREVLEETLAALEGLVEDEEASTPDLVSTMAALGRMAELEGEAGHLDEAEGTLARAMELTERLLARHPQRPSAWVEMGEALRQQALLSRARGLAEETLAQLERACAYMDGAVERGGELALVRRHWYLARNELASELVAQARGEEGLWLLEENLEWIERLAGEDRANRQLQRDLVVTLRRLADGRLRAGELEAAQQASARAGEIARAELASEPENAGWRWQAALTRAEEGRAFARQSRAREALRAFDESLTTCEALVLEQPHAAEAYRNLLHVHRVTAEECARLLEARAMPGAESAALSERGRACVERGRVLYEGMRELVQATPADESLRARLEATAAAFDAPVTGEPSGAH